MQHKSKTQHNVQSGVQERLDVGSEVSKVSITVVGVFAVIVSLWSFACIAGGLIASGGPLEFVKNWVRAITGI